MRGMRSLALAVAALLAGCSSYDPLVGTYTATVTGTDMQTSPTSSTSNVSGTGTLAITATKTLHAYVVTFGQNGYLCTLQATESTTTPRQLELAGGQQCHIEFPGGNFTATTTQGSVTLDPVTMSTATLQLSYGYSGTAIFNYAGNGSRTFTGPRL